MWSTEGQMEEGREEGRRGEEKIREDRKTYWPGVGPAVEAGCRASLCGPKGADGQRERGGRGRRGGTRKQRSILSELGSYPRGQGTGLARESEEERVGEGGGAVVLFISFYSGLKCYTVRERGDGRRIFVHMFEHLCTWKGPACAYLLP